MATVNETKLTEREIRRRVNVILNPTLGVRQSDSIYIFRFKCEHCDFISHEQAYWCEKCDDWIDGKYLFYANLVWRADGTVIVHGEGYADASK